MNFEYRSFPNHVYFGKGTTRLLPGLLKNNQKLMVIATERMRAEVDKLKTVLGEDRLVWFSKLVQHVPEALVAEATAIREFHQPDVLVAIGGGSAIGLAKALALEKYILQIAVPTTFSGSEQTNIYGISSGGTKSTGRDDKVLPGIVIYDTDLVMDMPKPLAVTSAMNAMAHVMEAVYSPTGNPVTYNNALLGMTKIKKGIKDLSGTGNLTESISENLLFGSWLAGKCLCEVEMSLHHKAAHVLGGSFGMEHAAVHTALQSYVLAYQWPHLSSESKDDFKRILDAEYPPIALKELAANAGAKTDLKSIGFKEEDIEKAAGLMMLKPYANIAPVTKEGLLKLLLNAYHGIIE
jgi:alcohol dehydrogenase class IV